MKIYRSILMLLVLILSSCARQNNIISEPEFWLGADIGWCTEYESKGYKFYTKDGKEMECTALMKELGLNAENVKTK